jgi:hydrogenase nickel incorporation protein HypB
MSSQEIPVFVSIQAENDQKAGNLNQELHARGIWTINVLGIPGAGKTSLIAGLVRALAPETVYVLEGDIESDMDSRRLRAAGVETVQINTHGACHLDAPVVAKALADFPFAGPGVLFIENIGNLVCPAEFNIGEDAKLLITTVTDGSDKPYKYPLAFEKAQIIVVNKVDLLPYVDFDWSFFLAGIRALNPDAPVIRLNARQGAPAVQSAVQSEATEGMDEGFKEIVQWIRQQRQMN